MSKTKIEDLIAAEAKAAEEAELTSDPNAPLPPDVKVTRGHPRARNLQVRFRDDEFDELSGVCRSARATRLHRRALARTPGDRSRRRPQVCARPTGKRCRCRTPQGTERIAPARRR